MPEFSSKLITPWVETHRAVSCMTLTEHIFWVLFFKSLLCIIFSYRHIYFIVLYPLVYHTNTHKHTDAGTNSAYIGKYFGQLKCIETYFKSFHKYLSAFRTAPGTQALELVLIILLWRSSLYHGITLVWVLTTLNDLWLEKSFFSWRCIKNYFVRVITKYTLVDDKRRWWIPWVSFKKNNF